MDIERLKEISECGYALYLLNDENLIECIRNNNQLQNYLSDSVDVIDDAITRQSVKSEEVQIEINRLQESLKQTKEAAKELKEQKYTVNMLPVYNQIKSLELQITALQAYQPWIPVSERLPTEADADEGMVLTYDTFLNKETFPYDLINEWNATHDNKITHWKPLPEQPKGE